MAERFGVGGPALSEGFETAIGKPPDCLLLEIGLWDAAQLACSGWPSATIASALGFPNEGAFVQRFERYHNGCPRDFLHAYRCHYLAARRHWAGIRQWAKEEGFSEEWLRRIAPPPAPPWESALRIICGEQMEQFEVVLAHKRRREKDGLGGGDLLLAPSDFRKFMVRLLPGQIRSGRADARETLTSLLWDRLLEWLRWKFPSTDREVLVDGMVSALMEYFEKPERFNSKRGDLENFLRVAAWRNVQDLRRGRARRKDTVELPQGISLEGAHPLTPGVAGPDEMVAEWEAVNEAEKTWERRRRWLREFIETLNAEERACLELMKAGERSFRPYAGILSLTSQPETAQQQAVNRVKHRLHERLKRWMKMREKRARQAGQGA